MEKKSINLDDGEDSSEQPKPFNPAMYQKMFAALNTMEEKEWAPKSQEVEYDDSNAKDKGKARQEQEVETPTGEPSSSIAMSTSDVPSRISEPTSQMQEATSESAPAVQEARSDQENVREPGEKKPSEFCWCTDELINPDDMAYHKTPESECRLLKLQLEYVAADLEKDYEKMRARLKEVDTYHATIKAQSANLKAKEKSLETKETNLQRRQMAMSLKEHEHQRQILTAKIKAKELETREDELLAKEKDNKRRGAELLVMVQDYERRGAELLAKEKENDEREEVLLIKKKTLRRDNIKIQHHRETLRLVIDANIKKSKELEDRENALKQILAEMSERHEDVTVILRQTYRDRIRCLEEHDAYVLNMDRRLARLVAREEDLKFDEKDLQRERAEFEFDKLYLECAGE